MTRPLQRGKTGAALLSVLATVTVLSAASACALHPDHGVPVNARPDMAQTVDRYTRMQKEIRDRVNTEAGPLRWTQQSGEGYPYPCSWGYPETPNVQVTLMDPWTFTGPANDARWPAHERTVDEVAHRYGFSGEETADGSDGGHVGSWTDPNTEANLQFGVGGTSGTMQVRTGCRLLPGTIAPADAPIHEQPYG